MSILPKTRAEMARYIDHTLLKPEATVEQIDRLCDECLQYNFAAACVNSYRVAQCAARLVDSDTAVASVVGFPLGANTSASKAAETRDAVEQGAREIDMVVNLGTLIAEDTDAVTRDIAAVVDAARDAHPDAVVKVILESRALTDEQIIAACRCSVAARADYVKTSTGFHAAGGATVEHVQLMKSNASPLKVKASGGIRDLPTALAMIEAGADRLGMSAGIAVIEAMGE